MLLILVPIIMADEIIYHMCDESDYHLQISDKNEYLSPTFTIDKFIHATGEPKFLLEAGNHFYKETKGKWICLKIDVNKLTSQVVYEAPAPVGVIDAIDYEQEHQLVEQPKFPHIYGSINKESVIEIYNIVRSEHGDFLSITGLV